MFKRLNSVSVVGDEGVPLTDSAIIEVEVNKQQKPKNRIFLLMLFRRILEYRRSLDVLLSRIKLTFC